MTRPPLPSDERHPSSTPRVLLARMIDRYNPGITMLVTIWVIGFAVRTWLVQHEMLTQTAEDALRSLLLVVPIMLVGWAVAAYADRRFKLGLFRSGDDQ